ncbi:MAG TPA: SUMF1/EgtB/PvdO family nonheme iron enzyme [Chthoniobacteraceae bacterium]|jgi:formylglycine-generating enzyme required for sulfatase activity|nr:SUMF1/EgtB/PvdO family nonheme iron enzyme [Chthoniobacteraceae bacterium]
MKIGGLIIAATGGMALLLTGPALRAQSISMSYVTIGNPNNPADPATGSLYGSVSYAYEIGEYDVTDSQYCTFLNAVDPSGTNALDLYTTQLANYPECGISFNSGAASGAKYTVIPGDENMPAAYVTYWDALRFVNWMNNGEMSASTETGAYTLLGGNTDGNGTPSNASSLLANPQPNGDATVWLPSENEWYKAAYYDSADGRYSTYATRSNNAPGNIIGNGVDEANCYTGKGYCVTQGTSISYGTQNYLTPVGSFTDSASYYGTYDQSGDVFNWLGTTSNEVPVIRGGGWDYLPLGLASSGRNRAIDPTGPYQDIGLRVASASGPVPVTNILFETGNPAPGAGAGGVPAGAVWSGFGNPAIDNDGNVAVIGDWKIGHKSGSGIFLSGSASDTLVAQVSGSVPGMSGAVFKTLDAPVIDSGSIAFLATLTGTAPAAALTDALSGSLAVIAEAGAIAPETNGGEFASFEDIAISGSSTALMARLKAGTGAPKAAAATSLGIWMADAAHPLTLALREGQVLASGTVKTLVSFATGNGSPGQGRGWLRAPGGDTQITALVTFTNKTEAVLTVDIGGTVSVLSQSGVAGAGGPGIAGATFATYGVPIVSATGHSAFLAKLTVSGAVTKANAAGVFADFGAGTYPALARLTGSAGTGITFELLRDPVLADDDGLAFHATLGGPPAPARDSIWWEPPGSPLELLAQSGGPQPPGAPAGAQWKAFNFLSIVTGYGPLFTATMTAGKGGITGRDAAGAWAVDSKEALTFLFGSGQSLGIETVKNFTVLSAVAGSTGLTRSFNSGGQVIWTATFTDGAEAILMTSIP